LGEQMNVLVRLKHAPAGSLAAIPGGLQQQHPVGREQVAAATQSLEGVGEVLEHVERRDAREAGLEVESLERTLQHAHPEAPPAEFRDPAAQLGPNRVESQLLRQPHERTVPAADFENSPGRPGDLEQALEPEQTALREVRAGALADLGEVPCPR